ncbi:hypothetical protein P3S67_027306 [Capsicum chacoense]
MASKGNVNGRRKKSNKGPDNLPTGQYTLPPPPHVTAILHPATTNILPPFRSTMLLPNAFFMPPPSDQFHTSLSQNSLHSSSSSIPSTSSVPSISGLRFRVPNTPTLPSIDSATTPNATAAASQNLQFKEVLEYDNVGRVQIAPYCDGFIPAHATGHMVIEAIKSFFKKPWNSWLEIPWEIKFVMWK